MKEFLDTIFIEEQSKSPEEKALMFDAMTEDQRVVVRRVLAEVMLKKTREILESRAKMNSL